MRSSAISLPPSIWMVVAVMAGKSSVTASDAQRAALLALSGSRDRGEADRARAMLLTLSGWTSPKIAEAFGVREDTVRFWRGAFLAGGVEALKARVAPGPVPVKSEAALRVAAPLLEAPVADRATGPSLGCVPRSKRGKACASVVRNCPRRCEKNFRWRRPRHTLKGRQIASEVERMACACNCANSRPKKATSCFSTATRARR